MRDEPALRRQWVLVCTLTSRRCPLTVREMAAEAGVSLKTVRRDIELFRSLGFPLEESTGEYGRKTWKITGTGKGPPLSFAFDEAAALYLGRRLLDPLAGTPFGEAARSAFQKIRAALGPTALEYLARFASVFHHTGFHTHDYARRNGLIEDLQVAIEDGKTVNLLYRSERATRPTYREVHPYGLVQHGGALYLVALDPVAEKVKHYKVDRIDDVEVTASPCRRPEGFDLADHLRSSFGVYQHDGEEIRVRIRFAPVVARYILESRWHESQTLTPQPDGGVLAEFRLSSTEEIKHWVMGFGSRAVVLEPASLRQEIVEDLERALESYTDSTTTEFRREEPSCPSLI